MAGLGRTTTTGQEPTYADALFDHPIGAQEADCANRSGAESHNAAYVVSRASIGKNGAQWTMG